MVLHFQVTRIGLHDFFFSDSKIGGGCGGQPHIHSKSTGRKGSRRVEIVIRGPHSRESL